MMQILPGLILFLVASLIIATPLPVLDYLESDSSARIVNGYAVDISEVPYQAALRIQITSGWFHICGAVIINSRALLTAAHCVTSYESQPSLLRVVVGTAYRLSGGNAYELSRIISHEEYSSLTVQNDIAMLVTSKTMSFSGSVNPVPFAHSGDSLPDGTEAIVSGYGTTEFEGTLSSVLLAARVNIVAQETCARAYLDISNITSDMICANGINPSRDACQGDSGGPLVANGLLVGIVSWGEGCADLTYPGVYTRVSEFSDWIGKYLDQIY